jgi:hypothetical protein
VSPTQRMIAINPSSTDFSTGLLQLAFFNWPSSTGLLQLAFFNWPSSTGLLQLAFFNWTATKRV